MSPHLHLATFCVLLFTGCTTSYTREMSHNLLEETKTIEHHQVTREHSWVLPQGAKILLAYPAINTTDQKRRLNRTQYQLAEALSKNFMRYFPASHQSLVEQTLGAALSDAMRSNQEFLIFPNLLVISDNPNALGADENPETDKKTALQVNLQIYDVRSRVLLETLKISSGQGWLDFSTQEPASLMDKALNEAAKQLSSR